MSTHIFKAAGPDGRVMLYGNTYPYREVIRAAGGKWDATDKAWYLPAGTHTDFLPATAMFSGVAPKVAPAPIAAVVVPCRRDGRCCEKAVSFFPSDDPYAHYGPAHYRCDSHGVTKSNYSGT